MNYVKTTENIKVLSIGDLHGSSYWELPIFGKVGGFIEWKENSEGNFPYRTQKYTHIVFVGDYVDSFHFSDTEILLNLENIIFFAKNSEIPVILLWGNHDVYYIRTEGDVKAGYRPSMQHSLQKLFLDNEKLFSVAYQIDHVSSVYRKFLWTHAGISENYYENDLVRLLAILEEMPLAEKLQFLFDDKHPVIFQEGYSVGGRYPYGGILWAREEEVVASDIEDGYNQIVGHTHTYQIMGTFNEKFTSSTFFIDTVYYSGVSQFLVIDTEKLDAEIFFVLEYDHNKKEWTHDSA